ncbi:hypothetical protein PC116_g11491 [Phytophthora cactorum]|uniref:Uncharacterized protein n=1 Tax=Phytophthora cactorum TaxID=29920 RepID=A0A8T1DU66_9STRA|nr:hypothetical protein PC114_g8992 [Phytophthora cactorum]KAG2945055.1 hypothetical protein PC117_g8790 [Phytophthora cactorum]KAG3023857.1 hypothetical protein PC120_g7344 [Phytophthora cactorum]KAG3024443.1 hypothetical protein PC119_g8493 [Phytophthora cactorum]KAG3175673.1 hypothetical protein C6341_g9377 [Phytophthora cactorum]
MLRIEVEIGRGLNLRPNSRQPQSLRLRPARCRRAALGFDEKWSSHFPPSKLAVAILSGFSQMASSRHHDSNGGGIILQLQNTEDEKFSPFGQGMHAKATAKVVGSRL